MSKRLFLMLALAFFLSGTTTFASHKSPFEILGILGGNPSESVILEAFERRMTETADPAEIARIIWARETLLNPERRARYEERREEQNIREQIEQDISTLTELMITRSGNDGIGYLRDQIANVVQAQNLRDNQGIVLNPRASPARLFLVFVDALNRLIRRNDFISNDPNTFAELALPMIGSAVRLDQPMRQIFGQWMLALRDTPSQSLSEQNFVKLFALWGVHSRFPAFWAGVRPIAQNRLEQVAEEPPRLTPELSVDLNAWLRIYALRYGKPSSELLLQSNMNTILTDFLSLNLWTVRSVLSRWNLQEMKDLTAQVFSAIPAEITFRFLLGRINSGLPKPVDEFYREIMSTLLRSHPAFREEYTCRLMLEALPKVGLLP